MKRSQILLSALGAVLLIALFYVVLFQPAREELAAVELAIAAEETLQQELTTEIARLQTVREQAPEVEAELALAEAIVPRDAALPSTLRQLQLAADESGVVLAAVTAARPVLLEGTVDGLSAIDLNIQLEGGYFQAVDFLRRIEDPAISPRGLTWSSAALTVTEYPTLSVSLTGSIYATIPSLLPPEDEATDPAADAAADEPVDGEAPTESDDSEEVDVDVDVDTEDAS